MALTSSYLVLFLLSCLVPDIVTVCPYPTCKCNDHFIDCNWKNLASLPELTNATYHGSWELTIYGNRMTTLEGHNLPTNLTFLDLRFNPITDIPTDAFDDSSNSLEILKFTNAKFTTLPPVLLNLTNLKELWIGYTPILEWNPVILKHLGLSLKKLVLDKVGVTTLPDWVKEFPFLSVDAIPISNVPDNVLRPLSPTLEDLTLSQDSLSRLPISLSDLIQLRNLDLTQNSLKHLDGLPKLAKLERLYISKNNISDINHLMIDLSMYNDTLIEIDLAYNRLSTIPELDQLSRLSSVKLYGNQIFDSTKGSFPSSIISVDLGLNQLTLIPTAISNLSNLTELLLQKNDITEIHSMNIPVQLRYLSLSQNKITELNDTSFPLNSSLEKLELDYNPLSTISLLAFQNLENLTYLDLSGSELARAPLALSSLPKLTTLLMRGSHDMVCTCAESQLTEWFLSHNKTMEVSGYCHSISISDFFLTLAPGC